MCSLLYEEIEDVVGKHWPWANNDTFVDLANEWKTNFTLFQNFMVSFVSEGQEEKM